ncbi:hypothetical protein [Streptomyces zagrosensis]|uniref:Transferase n=1 Tax=Streptomyces zagrosensis TaxID=1042984 RepID=A0A7W9UZV0_9ACTN|nr:hypothetical protein [Streptomyces zagrosensis]MBB5937443.1 hypothetical protein [Streptomyces zagrosensis]
MTTSAQRPTPASRPDDGASAPPRADSVADSAGGLTFDIADLPVPDPANWSAALVLRLRGAEPGTDDVRLPLSPAGERRVRAVLPSTVALPEGRWDVYVACADEEPRRLMPGLNDLRSLVDREPSASLSPLAVRIPYTTKHGNLSLRSWLRGPHVEAGDIRVDDATLTARGRLYRVERPAAWLAGAVVRARLHRDPSVTHTVPVTGDGADFTFALAYADLVTRWEGGQDVWDLWLCRAADDDTADQASESADGQDADGGAGRSETAADEVRIGRILDDVVDKKPIFTYPAVLVTTARGSVRAAPYYTGDNDLSVRIEGA